MSSVKTLQPVFFQENLCLSQESYTAHAEQKKTRPGVVCVCVFFLLCVRSPPPRSLTHSLALGSLAEIAI